MPSGPSSPRSASVQRTDSSPAGTKAPTAANPTESHSNVSNDGQDPGSPARLSWNHLRQGESQQRIRHGARQLLRLTENFSGHKGSGLDGGYEPANDHAWPTEDEVRSMSRLSHGIARDVSEIRALRKDDPNPQKRRVGESSRQQMAFTVDASGPWSPPSRRRRHKVEFSCHKCHRVDTPEWRPGPDGPSTLCNVCGLLYAKRERKKEESAMPLPASPKIS